MKKTNIFCTVLFFLLIQSCDHNSNKKGTSSVTPLTLYLDGLNYWCDQPPLNRMVSYKLTDTSTLFLYVKNSRGQLSFRIINKDKNIIMEGQYVNALDTFKRMWMT